MRLSRTVLVLTALFDGISHTKLQFTGGGIGERDRDDLIEAHTSRLDAGYDAADKLGGLPRPGRRLDYKSSVEIVANPVPRSLIGERLFLSFRHGISRSFLSSNNRSTGLREVRMYSNGPQTAR